MRRPRWTAVDGAHKSVADEVRSMGLRASFRRESYDRDTNILSNGLNMITEM